MVGLRRRWAGGWRGRTGPVYVAGGRGERFVDVPEEGGGIGEVA
jgi:hypothetical protein